MVVELFQQMGSAVIRNGALPEQMPLTSKGTPLKGGYHNHPCTRWVGESKENFEWSSKHALELCRQYTLRYGKVHSCQSGIEHLSKMSDIIPSKGLTEFAQAMPDQYRNDCAVTAYQTYYKNDKKEFAKWDKINNVPSWW